MSRWILAITSKYLHYTESTFITLYSLHLSRQLHFVSIWISSSSGKLFNANDAEISILLLLRYSSDSWYSRFYGISFNTRQTTKNPSISSRFNITRNFNNDVLCHQKLIFHNHKLLKLALRMLIVSYEHSQKKVESTHFIRLWYAHTSMCLTLGRETAFDAKIRFAFLLILCQNWLNVEDTLEIFLPWQMFERSKDSRDKNK